MITYRILFAEDITDDMELAERELTKAGMKFISVRVETKKDFITQLNELKPDVIISDYSMPGFNGMEALEIVLELSPFTPVIIHTGSINEETAVRCMKAGAFDYVLKDKIRRLPFALKEAYEKALILRQNKESQLALKISEQRYKGLFNSILNGVFYINKDGIISTINPAAFEILNIPEKDIYNITELENEWNFTQENGDHFSLSNFVNAEQSDTTNAKQDLIVKAENNLNKVEKWLAFSLTPEALDKDSELLHTLVIVEDITARKKSVQEITKAKLKAEESDRLKTAFLSNLSHEVRTPMNAILGFSELLDDVNQEDETIKFYTETIKNNSVQLLSIISDIIEISKIETEPINIFNSEFNLSATKLVIEQLFSSPASIKGIHLTVTGFEPEITVYSDEQKINKILFNLIDNAIKFTENGVIHINCILLPGRIEIHVKDTGIGINEEVKDKIFERFRQADEGYSRKHGGTGLGLSIAKAYAEALGGTIWYESNSNGTDFAFNLPVKWFFTNGSKVTRLSNLTPDYSAYTILIAEDDSTNFAFISRLLLPTGVKIIYASDGQDAIDQLNNAQHVDLILMDIKMPIMNGFEATEVIRKTNKEVPVIATTAYAMNGDKENCLKAGCNDYISKPIRRNELFNVMNVYLTKD